MRDRIHRELEALRRVIMASAEGVGVEALRAALPGVPDHTLRQRIKLLVEADEVERRGKTRVTTYHARAPQAQTPTVSGASGASGAPAVPAAPSALASEDRPDTIPLGERAAALRAALDRPVWERPFAGYAHELLREYMPERRGYLSEAQRARLHQLGRTGDAEALPGTYARRKHVYERLLVDLSWSSSYLEGSTLSRLDTERLLREQEAGYMAQTSEEAESLLLTLNHKAAIDHLLSMPGEQLAIHAQLIQRVHAQLAGGLLAPIACGRLREGDVEISHSTYRPLGGGEGLRAEFASTVRVAQAIRDPFERSIFILLHLPYLQPFEDVNKRTSRVIANVPLLQHNLRPLSFINVSRRLYGEALLGFYEQRDASLMGELYVWAYERSCAEFEVVLRSAEDPLQRTRLRFGELLRQVMRGLIKEGVVVAALDEEALRARIAAQLATRGVEVNSAVEDDLIAVLRHDAPQLHEGLVFYYNVTEAELERFAAAQRRTILIVQGGQSL